MTVTQKRPFGWALIHLGFFITVLALVGCKTQTREIEATHPVSKERRRVIYTELKAMPIPTPQVTPFDNNIRQRDAYLWGFKDGWDNVIRSDILFGLRSAPYDLPPDFSNAWKSGWHEGNRIGGERLSSKLQENP